MTSLGKETYPNQVLYLREMYVKHVWCTTLNRWAMRLPGELYRPNAKPISVASPFHRLVRRLKYLARFHSSLYL